MPGANIKIGASSSEFQNQMKEVTRQLKLVSSECSVATEKAKLFGKSTDSLKAKQVELTEKLKAQNTISGMYKDRIADLNGQLEKHTKTQSELKQKIDDTTQKYKASVDATGKNSDESKKLNEQLKQLKEEYAKNERAIESDNKQLDNAKVKLNDTEKAILQNKKALEDTNKQISNFNIDKVAEGFDKAGKKMTDAGKTLTTGVTTPIVGAGVAVGKLSIDFEDSMAKVSTIADETEVPIDKMKEAILDLSTQTGVSADDIAGNVYDAISAGQKTGDAVNFVSNATKLAKSGFAETGQSLDLLTTIMNSYGLEAEEVTNVSDILIQTQNLDLSVKSEIKKFTLFFDR